MNSRVRKHLFLRRGPILIGLGLCALILAVLLSLPSGPKPDLWIRFQGLSSNSLGYWDYTAAVPSSKRYAAVVFWSVSIEETNRTSVPADIIVQAPTNREYGSNEEGITTYNIAPAWDTNKVYRVVGYYQPGSIGLSVATGRLAVRYCPRILVPPILRLLPEPKSIAVTSQWNEVTALLKPF